MTSALAVRTTPEMSRGTPPLIRLLPAPDLEPPYEDEADAGQSVPRRQPARPARALPLPWPDDAGWQTFRSPVRPPVSEARLAAHRYLALCLEVLGGFRPLAHLRILTSAPAYGRVSEELTRNARHSAPPPAAPTGRFAPGGRVLLRHLRICEPRDGIAEVAAVLGRADQVWAMALRLERHHGVWLCSHLEMV